MSYDNKTNTGGHVEINTRIILSKVIERSGAVNEYKEACVGDFQTKKTHTDLRTRKICMGKVYGLLSNNVNKRCLALIHVSATEQHC
ncbi:MAG TPA: hypothetical protein DE044_14055 [Alteromonas macleodii]|nr:hypothetical protein [Alteromonas macleodii]